MDAAPAPVMTSTPGTDSGVTLKPPDVIVPASALASQAAAAAAANTQPSEVPCVVVFDLETTGLNKDRNRIIEIAAVSFFSFNVCMGNWYDGMFF
jgi:DNA polymerase III epsilon subunit-like protein